VAHGHTASRVKCGSELAFFTGARTRTLSAHTVELRCYIRICRCLARNARRNTTSHLTADAGFSYISRAKRLMYHHVTPHRRREWLPYDIARSTRVRFIF